MSNLAFTLSVQASPFGVRLSWVGDPTTSMTITWNTGQKTTAMAEFSTNQSGPFTQVQGSSQDGGPELGYIHHVELENLMPAQLYYYRVGEKDGNFSQIYTFKTASLDPCKPTRFVALGDARAQKSKVGPAKNWPAILKEAWDEKPEFIINNGDMVRDGNNAIEWKNWLISCELAAPYIPQLLSMGNHDDGPGEGDTAHYNQVVTYPRHNTHKVEDYYYVVYHNLLLISFSTMTFKEDGFKEQAEWLDRVLTTHQDKQWKIIFMHHPVYTSYLNVLGLDVGHPSNEQEQNQRLLPIIDKHHVDLVLQSHVHWYERFRPMKGDLSNLKDGIPVQDYQQGTLYVTTGGAGAYTYPETGIKLACGRAKGSVKCSGYHHYMLFDVEKNRLQAKVKSTACQNFTCNAKNQKEIDSFEIIKHPSSNEQCLQAEEDLDQDGHLSDVDCDDGNPTVYPGAVEICGDNLDQDCDGQDLPCSGQEPDAGDGSAAGDGDDESEKKDISTGAESDSGTSEKEGTSIPAAIQGCSCSSL